jgi:hypothetical protein
MKFVGKVFAEDLLFSFCWKVAGRVHVVQFNCHHELLEAVWFAV